jgi:hypothetical protein
LQRDNASDLRAGRVPSGLHEPYTLDLFLASKTPGQLALLAYAQGIAPVAAELVLEAREVRASSPYGLGFALEVPPVSTFPDASDASLESIFLTIGVDDAAYYERVHGRRQLVHVRGVVVPKRCPAGGFPYAALVSFDDGSSLTNTGTIACPGE